MWPIETTSSPREKGQTKSASRPVTSSHDNWNRSRSLVRWGSDSALIRRRPAYHLHRVPVVGEFMTALETHNIRPSGNVAVLCRRAPRTVIGKLSRSCGHPNIRSKKPIHRLRAAPSQVNGMHRTKHGDGAATYPCKPSVNYLDSMQRGKRLSGESNSFVLERKRRCPD